MDCEICGKPIPAARLRRRAYTCSVGCAQERERRRRRVAKLPGEEKCLICGKPVPIERRRKGAVTCSHACGIARERQARRVKEITRGSAVCLVCEAPVPPERRKQGAVTCSPACGRVRGNSRKARTSAESTPLHLFCARGRTYKEISQQYGWGKERIDRELSRPVEGYELFCTRNQWHEKIFVYLPIFSDEIEVKPKIWSYRKQPDGQPYLWIQFPDDLPWTKIKVVPISDAHRGCFAHDRVRFDEYINWIAHNENVFFFINGDLGDWGYGDSNKGTSVYEQEMRPRNLRMELTHALAPIAHKCLWAISGTHEWRSQKYDFDPLEWICDKLEIPYFNEPVYVDILWNGYVFDFWCQHGTTSSRTKGGKLNAATEPTKWQEFTMFTIMGHVHDEMQNKVTRICRDRVNFRLEARKQYVIICPAFMEYFGTYAARSALPPGALGAVACELYANGDYHASS